MIGIAIANSLGLSAAAAGPDPSASAYFTATGITGATQQTAIDNLVKGLKADGLWSKMKAVYPFVTDNRNILSYTNDFSNAYWEKAKNGTGVTPIVTINSIVAPDGTTTASRMQLDRGAGTSAADFSLIYNTGNITLSATGVYSFYAKSQTGSNQSLLVYWGAGQGTTFTLTTTWQRFQINNLSAASNAIVFGTRAGSGSYFNGGQQVLDIAVWHPQLELGSTATTYQPMLGSQQAFISSQFKYNLVNPVDSDAAFRLVFNGGWTHSSNGATPNGTNGYADTKFNNQGNWTATSNGSIGVNIATNPTAGIQCDMGSGNGADGSNSSIIYSRFVGDVYYAGLNCTSVILGNANTSSIGLFVTSRLNTTQHSLYKRGSSTINSTATNAIGGNPNRTFYIGAANSTVTGNASNYSDRRYNYSFIGDGLTQSEVDLYYARITTFNTALSR